MESFRMNCFKFGQVVQEEISFVDISYLELWQPFFSAEQNLLCNFVRGHYTIQYKYHMSIKNTKCISSKSCKYRVSIGTR